MIYYSKRRSSADFCFRLTDWIPDVPKDVSWLYGLVEDMYKQAWKDEVEDDDGYVLIVAQ